MYNSTMSEITMYTAEFKNTRLLNQREPSSEPVASRNLFAGEGSWLTLGTKGLTLGLSPLWTGLSY